MRNDLVATQSHNSVLHRTTKMAAGRSYAPWFQETPKHRCPSSRRLEPGAWGVASISRSTAQYPFALVNSDCRITAVEKFIPSAVDRPHMIRIPASGLEENAQSKGWTV